MARMITDFGGLGLMVAVLLGVIGCSESGSELDAMPAAAGLVSGKAAVNAGTSARPDGAGEIGGRTGTVVQSREAGVSAAGVVAGARSAASVGNQNAGVSGGLDGVGGAATRPSTGGDKAGTSMSAGDAARLDDSAGEGAGESAGLAAGRVAGVPVNESGGDTAGASTAGAGARQTVAGGFPLMGGQVNAGQPGLGGQPVGGVATGGAAMGGAAMGGAAMGGEAICVATIDGGDDIDGQDIDFTAPPLNVIQTLINDGRFSHLLRMVQVASPPIESDLSTQPVALLAATDQALEAYYNDFELLQIKSSSVESRAFLRRHMVRGHRDFSYLSTGEPISTEAGRFLPVTKNGDMVEILGVPFVDEGIRASNGWVHPISGVIELPDIDEPAECEAPLIIGLDSVTFGGVDEGERAHFRFTAPEAGTYCFDTTGSPVDTVIRVEDDCARPSFEPNRYNDHPVLTVRAGDVIEEQTHPDVFSSARIAWTVEANQVVDIVVNAANLQGGLPGAGDFKLSAYFGPCTPLTMGDYLDALGHYSIFLDLVRRFELEYLLTMSGARTVFAPDNAAFANFEAEAPGDLAARAQDGQEMWALLRYHFMTDARLEDDLLAERLNRTEPGPQLEAVIRVNQAYINGALIDGANRITDNGVVHEIDGILSPPPSCEPDGCSEDAQCVGCVCLPNPPPGTVLDELRRRPEYSIFVELVDFVDNDEIEAGVATVLADTGTLARQGITAFVPTNDSFDEVDVGALKQDPTALARTLRYHVARGLFSGEDLAIQTSLDSFSDAALPIQQTLEGPKVADVPIVSTDINASNGVIHVVQRLLTAPPLVDACSEAVAIEEAAPQVCDGADSNRWCYYGTTIGAGAVYDARCVAEDEGPERVFRFRPTTAGRYCMHTLDSPNLDGQQFPLDTLIYIRETRCTSSLNAVSGLCNDDCDGSSGGGCGTPPAPRKLSSLTVELEANTDYFIFVDTYELYSRTDNEVLPAPRGNFTLTIEKGRGCGEDPPAKTLRQLIAERPELSNFNDQITRLYGEQTGLPGGDAWPGAGQHTIFAPTNDAFSQIDAAQLQDLLNSDEWQGIVGYHMTPERLAARVIDERGEWFTLGPPDIPLFATSRGGELIVGGARIVVGELQASNGILYTIDTVLLPPNVCAGDNDCEGELVCGQAGVCVELPPLYTCQNPYPIPSDGDLLFGTLAGDTAERVSYEGASCADGAEAPDHVYTLTGAGAFLSFDGSPVEVCLRTLGGDTFPNGDTALHVRRGSCSGAEVACVDDVVVRFGEDQENQVNQVEAQLTLQVEAGETYYIFVDGSEEALRGEYELLVYLGKCEAD
ncbi:MAG: fasciclin domain-containing protein [Myxococcota bacterium]|nr:fasciclin domain-containing protein [Myxococcota bacterium]